MVHTVKKYKINPFVWKFLLIIIIINYYFLKFRSKHSPHFFLKALTMTTAGLVLVCFF